MTAETQGQESQNSQGNGGEAGGGSNEKSLEARLEAKIASKAVSSAAKEESKLEIPVVAGAVGGPRGEVSASTVMRMLGVATQVEIQLLESKLELILTRINNLTVRVEKMVTSIAQMPTGSDLERIDVQMGSLKSSTREVLSEVVKVVETQKELIEKAKKSA